MRRLLTVFSICGFCAALGVLLWSRVETKQPAESESFEQLMSLGYMGGYRTPDDGAAVLAPKESEARQSRRFLYASGHAPVAYLVSQTGEVIHSWEASFSKVFPGQEQVVKNRKRDLYGFWRHVTLLPNNELLAVFEGLGLVKLDAQSRILWARLNGAHHDVQVLHDGSLVVLTRKPEQRSDGALLVDAVTFLSAQGEVVQEVSVIDAILTSPFRAMLLGKRKVRGDILHTNSIEVLDMEAASLWNEAQEGDVLLSMRNIDALAILRPASGEIVWAHKGIYKQQHFARVIKNERKLLLFDNIGAGKTARVLAFSLPSMELVSTIGSTELGSSFSSRTLGLAHRLSNGNTMVVESEGGRIFEVNPQGEVVWRFANPHRTGEGNRLIATIPHVQMVE